MRKSAARWPGGSGKELCPISVNLPRESMESPDFAKTYDDLCHRYEVASGLIEFELAEPRDLEDGQRLRTVVEELHSCGFQCALDSFGKRFIALKFLRDLDADAIKLDRSFFYRENNTSRSRYIVEAVLRLAAQMHIRTVAEGIDNASQVRYLQQVGCDMVQGLYYFKPMPVEEFQRTAYRDGILRHVETEETRAGQEKLPAVRSADSNLVMFSYAPSEDRVVFSTAFSPALGGQLVFSNAQALFRMSLLSKSNYCALAMILGAVIFSRFALSFERFLTGRAGLDRTVAMLLITLVLVVIIAALYFLITRTVNGIFAQTEQKQQMLTERFGEEITHMLSVAAILQGLSDTIQEAVHVDRIFAFIRDLDGQYRIEHTTNPLEEKNFYVRSDHPLVGYFKTHTGCVIQQEFARSTIYRSMWEKEKLLLKTLDIECFVPMLAENDLVGLVMLAGKKDQKPYQSGDMNFLQSICGICADSAKNAYTYERALEGARKDSLTNLVNRKFFFELLEQEFEKCRDTALSLCLLNVDDFKLYNQLYGTQEGNLALQRVAGILAASINESGYAARIGGKEFALILPGYDIYSAKCLAENVAAQISEINHYSSGETVGRLTVSVGICAAPYMASSAKELFKNADTAVYTVKRSGKNAVLMYSAEISRRETQYARYKSGYSEHASTIYALTAAIDTKDHYTFQHSQNVAYYASELAKAAGMGPDLVEIVKGASLLHDVGKIGVREDILNKPGKLETEEYEIMKGHVENAVNIIRYLPSLDYVIPTVLSYHERYDGRDYPRRLAGDEIPIMGRVLCIADALDAITSVRSYKVAATPQEAVCILREEAGKQFDPNLVTVFTELVEENKIEMRTQHVAASDSRPASPADEGV